jgi:hypothetical protein
MSKKVGKQKDKVSVDVDTLMSCYRHLVYMGLEELDCVEDIYQAILNDKNVKQHLEFLEEYGS